MKYVMGLCEKKTTTHYIFTHMGSLVHQWMDGLMMEQGSSNFAKQQDKD